MNEILSNESNEFNEIINNIKKKILNYESEFETKEVIKKWFVELNNEDVNILSIMATYLMVRISNLFMTNLDNLKQLKKNKLSSSLTQNTFTVHISFNYRVV